MTSKPIVAVRLQPKIIAHIDALKRSFSTEYCEVSRSDVIRTLILRALEQYERPKRRTSARKAAPKRRAGKRTTKVRG